MPRPEQPWRRHVTSQEETLKEWCQLLLEAYHLDGVRVDVAAILSLAGVAAHSVVRPAAPLTTFVAGYAAGLAAAQGKPADPEDMAALLGVARALAADYEPAGKGAPGE